MTTTYKNYGKAVQGIPLNNEGKATYIVSKWERLNRFLILGSEGGSYYAGARELTKEAIDGLTSCIAENGPQVVRTIVEVSAAGRATSNNPALFALAVTSAKGDLDTRRAAFAALTAVARIPTHLFHFIMYRESFAGWGRGMKGAVRNWYQSKEINNLAYHAVKYKGRDGWTNADVLRLAKPKPDSPERDSIYSFMVKGVAKDPVPKIIAGHDLAKAATSATQIADIIKEYKLPREAIPTKFLNDIDVWRALLPSMPMNALVRNLGKMSDVGLFKDKEMVLLTVEKLTTAAAITKSRIHPMQILTAMKVYGNGRGVKGSLTWAVTREIVDALDVAFYLSFDNATPSGKSWIVGIDVSASMGWTQTFGGILNCSEVAAAMAMTLVRTEPRVLTLGFDSGFKNLNILKDDTVIQAMDKVKPYNYGGTDCSLPITWAMDNNIENEGFMILTDNETNSTISASRALNKYRDKTGIDAKLIVVGMEGNDFTIADPNDSGMLDVVGMDTSVPQVTTDFVRGYELLKTPRFEG